MRELFVANHQLFFGGMMGQEAVCIEELVHGQMVTFQSRNYGRQRVKLGKFPKITC
jgi:hypothetical protein